VPHPVKGYKLPTNAKILAEVDITVCTERFVTNYLESSSEVSNTVVIKLRRLNYKQQKFASEILK
jgi:hypothetical protein